MNLVWIQLSSQPTAKLKEHDADFGKILHDEESVLAE